MVSSRERGGAVDLAGQSVSHYRVLRKLGGGGMGVVYEAEDVRLRRRVALKFLPESLAHNHEALQRFQREARAASSLNHPNICTIHEIEEHDGQPVIVMELIQGCTLKQRLAEGPLPIELALDLAVAICDGLEAAHAQGIVHRDIKPANIFLTSQVTAKILDFGLAKLLPEARMDKEDNGTPADDSELSLTVAGVIRGTTCYMSPEQARGDELDRRTDLFSLGTVLYEMVTGQRPFVKKNVVLTIDAILNTKPVAASKLNVEVPPELEAVIAKALEKRREQRYQTAADMASDLKRLRREMEAAAAPRGSESRASGAAAAIGGPVASAVVERVRVAADVPRTQRGMAKYWKLLAPAAVLVAVLVGGLSWRSRTAHALTEKDMIVLADFDNKTGDQVFDDTLKQALAVDLGQSPFLNILSERKVAATLRLMGRSPDQPVTGEVAREVCQRVGSKALLAGSIAQLGSNYVIGLNAINCATGDALVREQAQARGKDDVLKALGKAGTAMRGKLGESLASVQKSTTPIQEATTASLEALKAFSMGRKLMFQSGNAAALPSFQRAVELDPNFALAYRYMSVVYFNLGQSTRASENAKKAFELRERVSERERYAIEAMYYSYATGDLEKANQVYELWKQSYPRDDLPVGNLGDNFMRLGQWEKALRDTEDGLHLEPNNAIAYSNLAWMQLALNRPEDAKATVQQAWARNMDTYFLRLALYQTAFLRGEENTMRQQLEWVSRRPREENWLLSAQSDTEAYFGRLAKAREFSQRAIDSAVHADARETAALWQVNAALREAEFGNSGSARHDALAALALVPGKDVSSVAALSLARAGDTVKAKRIADNLNREFPQDTPVQGYWLPAIRAAIELNAKNPTKAVEFLKTAAPYELGQCEPFQLGMLYPVYIRGQAYLQARQGKEAAAEFQNILDHRGIVVNFPTAALAHLGLARAYALQGDTAKARAAYHDFLTLWRDADAGIPILQQAKAEYARLQ
jgi:tetratricopeptide (TPR) repeat protein/tRNA A-37 threonylcarbamoyl transferase component Bud32